MTGPTSEDALRARAAELGFDACGIAAADAIPEAGARLDAFLADGREGDMAWLAAKAVRRRSPQALWPEARSVIALAMNYGPDHDPMGNLKIRDAGNISVYARGRDYHDVLKKRVKQLARWMAGTLGGEVKVFVDTAPVMEKPLAEAAGLGWQGKHTNLVSRDFGSWLFLAEIYSTLKLAPDRPHDDRCGSCRACLDICPTAAFPAPYQLDARRCISYLTIEHQSHIAPEFRKAMGNRVYGCDDCLAICPWNRFAVEAREAKLKAREDLSAPPLAELAELDETGFRALFSGSPVKRTGRDRFVRNVLIAIGNSGDRALLPQVTTLLGDASPLVRAMAVWALGELAGSDKVADCAALHAEGEPDPNVRREWAALGITPG